VASAPEGSWGAVSESGRLCQGPEGNLGGGRRDWQNRLSAQFLVTWRREMMTAWEYRGCCFGDLELLTPY